MVLMLYKYVFT